MSSVTASLVETRRARDYAQKINAQCNRWTNESIVIGAKGEVKSIVQPEDVWGRLQAEAEREGLRHGVLMHVHPECGGWNPHSTIGGLRGAGRP